MILGPKITHKKDKKLVFSSNSHDNPSLILLSSLKKLAQFSILHGMKLKFFILLVLSSLNFYTVSAQPDTVKVGTFIISVHDINFHDKEYTMRFWLWFLYTNPDFDFSGQLDITNAKSIEQPDMITDKMEGKTWAMMKMKCVMKENWQVHDFQFDKQHLKLKIENSIYDVNSLIFEPDVKGSIFGDDETIDGWTITNFKVSSNINQYQRDKFSAPHPEH